MNWPTTIPLTVKQYESLVERGDFNAFTGQVELIRGRIMHMNPQGPQHSIQSTFLPSGVSSKQIGDSPSALKSRL